MNIIGQNVMIEFAQKHPNARSALNRWYNLMRQETLDFQTALELTKQQGNDKLKVEIEKILQELNNSTPKTDET